MGNESKEEKARAKALAKVLREQEREEEKKKREIEKAEKAEKRNQEIAAREKLALETEQKNRERYGKLVIEELCAGKLVRIYDKCFVRVSGIMIGKSTAPYEKLLGISGAGDVAKKTGIGRVAVAGMTGGMNLLLTPNKRGDMYLTITTSEKTHMLHMDPPTERDMKAMHKLASAGQAILDATAALHVSIVPETTPPSAAPVTAPPSSDFVEQLEKLATLHKSGVLSDEEFNSAKSRILGGETATPSDSESTTEKDVNVDYVNVILVQSGPEKIAVIKAVREFVDLGLKEAKTLIDNAPSTVATNMSAEVAEQLRIQLETLGAQVEFEQI
jgi:large subunit ribosomal protein L7/L12